MRLIGSMADGLGTVEPRAVDIGWIPEAAGDAGVLMVVFCGVKGGQERSRRAGEERKGRIMRYASTCFTPAAL